MKKIVFADIYNNKKSWQITQLNDGNYFLQEFIEGKAWNCGSKCSLAWLYLIFDAPQWDIKNKLDNIKKVNEVIINDNSSGY